MQGLNKVQLIGHLGKDPEVRSSPSGKKMANLRLATSESWRDKQTGERKERTEWHTVVIFNENLVKIVESYVKKGSKIYVEGKLATRKWQDQNGADRYSTEVVLSDFDGRILLLDGRSGSDQSDGGESRSEAPRQAQPAQSRAHEIDDEIPF
jgi:single-strand DNA-binding protein